MAKLNSTLVGASDSFTIPAFTDYAVAFLTGTGTFNGVAVPAGFSREGRAKEAIEVTTDAASSCYVDVEGEE